MKGREEKTKIKTFSPVPLWKFLLSNSSSLSPRVPSLLGMHTDWGPRGRGWVTLRMSRDSWHEQAQFLASCQNTSFSWWQSNEVALAEAQSAGKTTQGCSKCRAAGSETQASLPPLLQTLPEAQNSQFSCCSRLGKWKTMREAEKPFYKTDRQSVGLSHFKLHGVETTSSEMNNMVTTIPPVHQEQLEVCKLHFGLRKLKTTKFELNMKFKDSCY